MLFSQCLFFEEESLSQAQTFKEDTHQEKTCKWIQLFSGKAHQNLVECVFIGFLNPIYETVR